MTLRRIPALAITAIASLPATALAHPGHHHHHHHDHLSLWSGLLHPVTGVDHLLAALVVGAFAVLIAGGRLKLPATFVGAMIAGAALAFAGFAIPAAHALSAATVVALGLMLIKARDLPLLAAGLAVGAVGLVHGAAHATGLSAGLGLAAAYVGAMTLSTALLHALGFAAATWWFSRSTTAPRWAGAAVTTAGLAMVVAHFVA